MSTKSKSAQAAALSAESFTEILVEALASPKVLDALYEALASRLQQVITDAIDGAMTHVYTQLHEKDREISSLQQQVENLEAYTRVDNVIVHGIKEAVAEVASISGADSSASIATQPTGEPSASTEQLFIEFCRSKLDVNIQSQDISVAHRLGQTRSGRGPRPIIVRFVNRKAKNQVLQARKRLRTDNTCRHIFINEHLTPRTAQLFQKARHLVKMKSIIGTWTWNGKIYIKTVNGSKKLILTDSDLSGL